MSQSKGGHANMAKFDDDERRPFKTMIEWQNIMFDAFILRSTEEQTLPDPEAEDGISFALIVRFSGAPYEKVFHFQTEDLRRDALTNLKAKLLSNNVVIS